MRSGSAAANSQSYAVDIVAGRRTITDLGLNKKYQDARLIIARCSTQMFRNSEETHYG
jgi:hypothetical protein